MNRRDFIKQVTVGAAALAVLPRLNGAAAEENANVVFEPKDHGRALVNPAMGWTMHYYSNIISNYGSKLEPSDTLDDFPGLSTVYLRVPWSFIELEEGRFNWELLDTPAQRWIQKGKKVAFRITA
ncbi:MAG: twin-arginine translocation signal domain-containing protein, partial [Verrucomicrobia bacterium]|nr:twin-arginine translocation signal domain-containing protein [Verrucomicrobiota bacterium]